MTKLAMFYNSYFDTLFCYTNQFKDNLLEVKEDNLVLFRDEQQLVSFNINSAQNALNYNFRHHGIVSDDISLKEEVIKFLEKNNVTIPDFDETPQFFVGYVEKCEKIQNSDKLSLCVVNIGHEVLQIVCGAKNVSEGLKVVVAKIGTLMPNGLYIKESNLKGVSSYGMLCSAKELGLENDFSKEGIITLDDSYKVGSSFWKEYEINGR